VVVMVIVVMVMVVMVIMVVVVMVVTFVILVKKDLKESKGVSRTLIIYSLDRIIHC
jgi:hypothetical protein